MRIIVPVASFFGHISSCSHHYPKRQVGWAQFGPWGHVSGGLGAIRAVCRAWQAFYFALGTITANPRVPQHPRGWCFRIPPGLGLRNPPGIGFPHPPGLGLRSPPGIGFPHPLSPCMHVRFGCKPVFSARGYTYTSLCLQRAPRTLRSCRPTAVQPPSSSSLQLYARVAAVAVADC